MTNKTLIELVFAMLALTAAWRVSAGTAVKSSDDGDVLVRTIATLDAKVFDAYNRCDLETFRGYFAPKVEFYHDEGGATFDRATVVANTRKYICHKVRRELLPLTLRIYPIRGYGAIEEGEHRFCQTETGACEGIAKFLMIWQSSKGRWRLTRVVSYGHRALTEIEKVALQQPQADAR